MQLKVNFLCRDSILAAPLVLDLVLLMDLAKRANLRGTQDWLGFFFKSPMSAGGSPEHDLFRQRAELERTLLRIAEGCRAVPIPKRAATESGLPSPTPASLRRDDLRECAQVADRRSEIRAAQRSKREPSPKDEMPIAHVARVRFRRRALNYESNLTLELVLRPAALHPRL